MRTDLLTRVNLAFRLKIGSEFLTVAIGGVIPHKLMLLANLYIGSKSMVFQSEKSRNFAQIGHI